MTISCFISPAQARRKMIIKNRPARRSAHLLFNQKERYAKRANSHSSIKQLYDYLLLSTSLAGMGGAVFAEEVCNRSPRKWPTWEQKYAVRTVRASRSKGWGYSDFL